MFKYQKGYIYDGSTFVVNKADVHNAPDDMFVEAAALLPAPDVMTNADRIRAMNDKDLTEFIVYTENRCKLCSASGRCDNLCLRHIRNWLQQPAEEV